MKLNQIIAVEKGVKARTYQQISELHKVAQKAPAFEGMTRDYTPKNDDGDRLPSERKIVQVRVQDLLAAVRLNSTEIMDITAQKDLANCEAAAPVVVDGRMILTELPATTLIFLEKTVIDLRTLIAGLPELDVAESWEYDTNSGLHRTKPVQTQRTKKEQRPLVLFPATDKHPAQTQLVTEDVLAGYWDMTRQSGAIAKPVKMEMLSRVDKLINAIKEAREQANGVDANIRPQIGAAVFDYLLNG